MNNFVQLCFYYAIEQNWFYETRDIKSLTGWSLPKKMTENNLVKIVENKEEWIKLHDKKNQSIILNLTR